MTRFRRFVQIAGLVLVFPALAHAHPGHEGHELTWDFNHLVAHPLATLMCFAVLAAGAWAAWRIALWGGLIPQDAVPRDKSRR
jgi:hydrogenase/urease accessory protein HupE